MSFTLSSAPGSATWSSQVFTRRDVPRSSVVLILIACAVMSIILWVAIASFGEIGKNVAVLFFGCALAITAALLAMRRISDGLTVIAYLAALEPAFRLYGVALPYLALEYGVLFLALIVLVRTQDRTVLTVPVLCYGIYILIELAGLMQSDSPDFARAVLFPSLALFSCLLISSRIRLVAADSYQIINGFLIGACGMGALVGRVYFSGQAVRWSTGSNFEASGGMGPNQISLILSIAAFLGIIMLSKSPRLAKVFYAVLTFAFSYLMILTFSRGGGYLLAGAVLVHFVLLQKPSLKSALAVIVMTLMALIAFDMALDKTGGAVALRFNQLDTTNRTALLKYGWSMFLDHPLLGVGTGNYYTVVKGEGYMSVASGAHNELTRSAAEHGVIGLLAWLLFALASLREAAKNVTGSARALRLTLVCFAMVAMSYNGLKLIIQPLLILMAFSVFRTAAVPKGPESHRRQRFGSHEWTSVRTAAIDSGG